MIDRTNEPKEPVQRNDELIDRTQETTGKSTRRMLGWGIVALAGLGFFFFAPALAFIGGSVILMLLAGAVVAGLAYLVYRMVR